MLKRRQELEARKPKPREGICRVCGGVVTEEFRLASEPFTDHTPLGVPRATWWRSTGLSCQECGIQYAKLPPRPK